MTEISPVLKSDLPHALELIRSLLIELNEESSHPSNIDKFAANIDRLLVQPNHHVLVAKTGSEMTGIITLSECFGIYAGGHYGVINEMYVHPDYRSKKIGGLLIQEARKLAIRNKWSRLDVTAPIEEKWQRAIQFYETQGFRFTGEKLRLNLLN